MIGWLVFWTVVSIVWLSFLGYASFWSTIGWRVH